MRWNNLQLMGFPSNRETLAENAALSTDPQPKSKKGESSDIVPYSPPDTIFCCI
jgi:hypothetical protein